MKYPGQITSLCRRRLESFIVWNGANIHSQENIKSSDSSTFISIVERKEAIQHSLILRISAVLLVTIVSKLVSYIYHLYKSRRISLIPANICYNYMSSVALLCRVTCVLV
jgi:hypothetical protein